MGFFKRKPDTNVMGFLVNQTTLNRINEFEQEENISLYALSTCIIGKILEQQYKPHIIEKTLQKSDEFYLKSQKQVKNEALLLQIQDLRNEMNSRLDLQDSTSFHELSLQFKQPEVIEEAIQNWVLIPLLISSDIKSE